MAGPVTMAITERLDKYMDDLIVQLENKAAATKNHQEAETNNKFIEAINSHINELMASAVFNINFERRTEEDLNFASFWRKLSNLRWQWDEIDDDGRTKAIKNLRHLHDAANGPNPHNSSNAKSESTEISHELRDWVEYLLSQLTYKTTAIDIQVYKSIDCKIVDIMLKIRTEASFERQICENPVFARLWTRLGSVLPTVQTVQFIV